VVDIDNLKTLLLSLFAYIAYLKTCLVYLFLIHNGSKTLKNVAKRLFQTCYDADNPQKTIAL